METETLNLRECSIDTNIILRWLIADNLEQASKVDKLLANSKLKKVHVADIVVAEVVWVLESVYDFDRSDVVEALETWFSNSKFVYNKNLFGNIIKEYENKKSLSFVDLMLVGYAKLNKATPLVTFDKKLAKYVEDVLEL